jgi:predicted amidohydrolase YtcJ
VPLDTLITGRIATLGGPAGFGWVEAIGIHQGRVAFAGSEVDLETRADPFTKRISLGPDTVAVPGLTDAHLHLAGAALALHQVDLTGAPTFEAGMTRVAAAHNSAADADAWLDGHGWDAERWGRWPSADDLERVALGRRVVLWAHDHHALLASHAALRTAGIGPETPDPAGGVIDRDAGGAATGILRETATRLVKLHQPAPDQATMEAGLVQVGRSLVALGVVAVHDPGWLSPDPDLELTYPAYAHLADDGELPIRVHVSLRDDALDTAIAGGLRSGLVLGSDPAGWARIGWQKCFADGSMGSRTAALLEDVEPDPARPLAANLRRGVWQATPEELAERVARAAAAGIATQIHAIGDAAVRAALDVLSTVPRGLPLLPRIEHAQMVHPDDRPRFAANGIVASIQPVHIGSDAVQARRVWGDRAETRGYPLASLIRTGAVVAFGTDAPVESFDPWPGIAMAVRREDPRWPEGTAPFGPHEAITLEQALRAACIDPAVAARELDRGRLVTGQRADLVVIDAAAIDDPVEPGGALATARPSVVMVDGEVVFER